MMLPTDPLLDQRPVRLYRFEERNDCEHCIRVIRPRFRNSFVGKILSLLVVQSEDKVNLDEVGSFVYMACDGEKKVSEIAEDLYGMFGDRVEPRYDRIVIFIKELFRRDLISFVRTREIPA